jgi:hypothetical protein
MLREIAELEGCDIHLVLSVGSFCEFLGKVEEPEYIDLSMVEQVIVDKAGTQASDTQASDSKASYTANKKCTR